MLKIILAQENSHRILPILEMGAFDFTQHQGSITIPALVFPLCQTVTGVMACSLAVLRIYSKRFMAYPDDACRWGDGCFLAAELAFNDFQELEKIAQKSDLCVADHALVPKPIRCNNWNDTSRSY